MTDKNNTKYPDNIIHEHKSANFNERPTHKNIDTLVMHYTEMEEADLARHTLCHSTSPRVSAHYLIYEDGSIYCLLDEKKRGWHAGYSHWGDSDNVNDNSIGIEIYNKGTLVAPLEPFTDSQMKSVIELSQGIINKYSIKPWNVVGHSDIAPGRKIDPGERFEWKLLSEHNVGLWFDDNVDDVKDNAIILKHGDRGEKVLNMQKNFSKYGYKITQDSIWGHETSHVINEFKRHFLPKEIFKNHIDSIWDKKSEAILNNLLLKKLS